MAAIAQQAAQPIQSAAENTGNFLKQAQSNAENALENAKNQIKNVSEPLKGKMKKQLGELNSGFINLKGQVDGAVKKMGNNIQESNNKFKTKADGSTKSLLEALWDYILSLFNGVKDAATKLANKAKQVSVDGNKAPAAPQAGGRRRGPRISSSKSYFPKKTKRRKSNKKKTKKRRRKKNTRKRNKRKSSRRKR
tara:strand:+ start:2674 stop:3255 length:582 start_codon:yes stop_codon:yes gene_type:complete